MSDLGKKLRQHLGLTLLWNKTELLRAAMLDEVRNDSTQINVRLILYATIAVCV